MAELGPAIAEIEAFADLDGGKLRRLVADRRGHRSAGLWGRLKADDVVKRALTARHATVWKPAVGPFEVFEPCDPFHHFLSAHASSW